MKQADPKGSAEIIEQRITIVVNKLSKEYPINEITLRRLVISMEDFKERFGTINIYFMCKTIIEISMKNGNDVIEEFWNFTKAYIKAQTI